MTILITYPKHKVSIYWRRKLEQVADVVYFPFRVLKPRPLTTTEQERITHATDLAITSPFGAQVFSDHLAALNPSARVHVLSQKLKKQLEENGVTNTVTVAPEENRRSLAAELAEIVPSHLCWLVGDHAQKYYQDYPGGLVVTYENTWDKAHEWKAMKLFLKKRITAVLVTSPSNFDRLYQVMTQVDSSDYRQLHYYVLGRGTGEYLAKKGLTVIYPGSKQQVLDHALGQIWTHEEEGK